MRLDKAVIGGRSSGEPTMSKYSPFEHMTFCLRMRTLAVNDDLWATIFVRLSLPYSIENKLVVGVSSSALFDFTAENEIFLREGPEAFRLYQIEHRADIPPRGTAFPFIKRLLHLNKVFPDHMPVEVVILSRNDPEAGLRMMDAMPMYDLDITRAFFLSGSPPYPYMAAVNACLYLSANKKDVKDAISAGYPAGHVLPCLSFHDTDDTQLRIAFDFDGVLVDDEAEVKFADGGLPLFHFHEVENRHKPLKDGPLMPLLQRISAIQQLEAENSNRVNTDLKAVRVSIITARNAPSHERLVNTLKSSGITVDELFLTGGIEKKNILDVIRPQIFFDDQIGHLKPASENTPCVHIPFGVRNK